MAERLLYPLWDAGLTVGHAVRTPDEAEAIAAERLDAATATLDGRLLAGDAPMWERSWNAVLAAKRADPRAFAEALRDDAARRLRERGAVSSLLEPDLKDGAGGLRDLQSVGWLRAVLGRPLEETAILREAELGALAAAEEFLVRVRGALHLETGRATDRILLEQQPYVAAAMGFVDEPGLRAVDGLMRAVFEHARQVEHVVASAFDRYLRGASGAEELDPTPEGALRALADVAHAGGVMPVALLDAFEAAGLPEEVVWTAGVREAFLDLLRVGPGGAAALETLDRLGLLVRFLPAWGAVRCRPQRDPYHRFSVDVHLLQALEAIARLLDDPGEDRVAARAAAAVGDRDALLLGALLHDIGKTGEGNHVPAGAAIAVAELERMGVAEPTRELAAFMVAEHLLLSDTATRRDLEDDDLVHDVAARIGDGERLAALYLLTVADAAATGPLAWTPWRAALVRELVAKVQRVLERGEVGRDTAVEFARRTEALRGALALEPPDAVEAFLRRMPRGYLAAVTPEQAVAQFPLIAPEVGVREVRTASAPGARAGTYALTVVAADRPGLLSLIAGSLSLAGLSILTAQAFTTEDGVAVDLFEVEGAYETEIPAERWREFRGTLRKAIEGRAALEHRVREKRGRYPGPRHDVPVRVSVDNEASDFFTVIEVSAPDRIGLLFDVTRTLAELGLDVHLAKVATYGERVVDAFYVRDELGRKVDDAERVAELERALRAGVEN